MKFFAIASILAGAVASVFGQTIELGAPANGAVITRGKNFTCQVIQPISMASCIQVGIALAIDHCTNNVCPEPQNELGNVLYAGPWTPTQYSEYTDGPYQNFTLQVDEYMTTGKAIFTLTHLCLLGAAPYPFLEFRNVTVTVK